MVGVLSFSLGASIASVVWVVGINMADKDKADLLVRSFAAHVGAPHVTLDKDNDWSIGDMGLHYDPTNNHLIGRVYIFKLSSHLFTPEAVAAAKEAMLELNSSKIIALFERSGGYFEFEDKKDMLFLKKSFAVETLSPSELNKNMDELAAVGAKWTFRWGPWAMDIIYGREPPPNPPIPVTRRNDPQHNEYMR
jgi:hypothetical protein